MPKIKRCASRDLNPSYWLGRPKWYQATPLAHVLTVEMRPPGFEPGCRPWQGRMIPVYIKAAISFQFSLISEHTTHCSISYINFLVELGAKRLFFKIKENFHINYIYKKYYTPKHFADLGINKIRNLIKSIGLFNTKAKNLYYLSKILLDKHQSKIPNNFDRPLAWYKIKLLLINIFIIITW